MEKNLTSYFYNNNWTMIDNDRKAEKTFKFKTFTEAFSWMTEVAFEAERLDHHPDWTNIYNTVKVLLSTHDKNKLTEKDISLAKIMEKAFVKYI